MKQHGKHSKLDWLDGKLNWQFQFTDNLYAVQKLSSKWLITLITPLNYIIGSIGYIMGGSGQKELLFIIFARNSVNHMLSGHAYSRAIRSLTLLQLARAQIVFNESSINDEQKEHLNFCFLNLSTFERINLSSAVEECKKYI